MNNPTFDSFFATLEDIGRAVARAVKYAVGAIAAMSWPVLLLTCVALALLITLVPLIVGLFLAFMAIKLIFSCGAKRAVRGPATPHRPVDEVKPEPKADDFKGE